MIAFLGLRVLDLTTAGLRAAGVFFADFGADVIAFAPADEAVAGADPADAFWGRGKRTLRLGPGDERYAEVLGRLAAEADVLIDDRPAPALDLAYDELSVRNPGLVCCRLSAFGLAPGPEDWGSRELIVEAKSGRLLGRDRLSGAPEDVSRPIYAVPPTGVYGAAMLAVQAIVAALIRREESGRGALIDTSVLDGISAATMRLAFERFGEQVIPSDRRAGGGTPLLILGIRLCFLTVQCADGKYIQMCCRQPHLYRNWMRLIGLEEQLAEEPWLGLPLGVHSAEDAVLWEQKVRRAMLARTQTGWMELFRAEDIGADPFLTETEFLGHEQMLENDRIAVLDDPARGTVTMVGTLVRADATPARIRPGTDAGPAETIQWHAAKADGPQPPSRPQAADATMPLAGFTILEAASYLAAPLGPTLLAALGARVIKLEPLGGDSFRTSGLEFVHICSGKESIALDLKAPGARGILARLIGISDAMIHNFRPGVPERLGLDFETVHRLNPRLAYVYGSSYGSRGSQRYRAAFHSTPNALSGGGIAQAGAGNPPVNDSYPDPVAGLAAGAALALGLYTAKRTGTGQYLETSMLASTGWVHASRLVEYAGRPDRPVLDSGQLGYDALRRLYPAADGWVLLDVGTAAERAALVRVVREAGAGQLAASIAAAGAAPPAVPGEDLATLFARRTAADWEALARSAGLPLVSAADMSFEEYLVHHGLVSSAEHPAFGSYWRLNDRVRIADVPGRDLQACAVGEHTFAILSELGYAADEIAQFAAAKVIGIADLPATI